MSRMDFTKILVYRRGGNVLRYHTETILRPETVAHHSANVAYICTILEDATAEHLYHALVHDIPEQMTGDIPYPFKQQNPALKSFVDASEEGFLRHNQMYLSVSPEIHQVVKAADMLDLVLKCVEEMRMGNSTVYEIYKTGIVVLNMLPLPVAPRAKLDSILQELDAWLDKQTIDK